MSCAKFWVIAFFVLINNGCSLLGHGQSSVGGIARSIESRNEIASATALLRAQKITAGDSPPEVGRVLPKFFEYGQA